MYFYIDASGQRQGPFSIQDLEGYAAKGFLKPNMMLIDEAGKQFAAISLVSNFKPEQPVRQTLVVCRQCNAQVSPQAHKCPQCGCEFPNNATHVAYWALGLSGLGFWIVWMIWG